MDARPRASSKERHCSAPRSGRHHLFTIDTAQLEYMRRAHDARQALSVLEDASVIGFEQVSADLIFGLPDQTRESWIDTLDVLIDLDVPHISTYGLTVESGTLLAKWSHDGKATEPAPRFADVGG